MRWEDVVLNLVSWSALKYCHTQLYFWSRICALFCTIVLLHGLSSGCAGHYAAMHLLHLTIPFFFAFVSWFFEKWDFSNCLPHQAEQIMHLNDDKTGCFVREFSVSSRLCNPLSSSPITLVNVEGSPIPQLVVPAASVSELSPTTLLQISSG